MRAAVIEEVGGAARFGERPEPRRPAGAALIRVAAAALNPVDVTIASGRHPAGAPRVPYAVGIEGVGRVVAGEQLAEGTRVRFSVPGGLVDGALAEFAVAPEQDCVPLPEELSDELAAAIGVVGCSALVGLRDEVGLNEGESVLIQGATGGVGQAAIAVAVALGARRVVAAGRNPERLDAVVRAWAQQEKTEVVAAELDPDPAVFAQRLAAVGGKVDVVADTLWGPYARAALGALAAGGRLVSLGQAAGAQALVDSAAFRHAHLTMRGLSSAGLPSERVTAAYREVVQLAVTGGMPLALRTFPLTEASAAWTALTGSAGAKIVVLP